MSKQVNILEVGPRDGWQNLKEYIPVEKKLEIIDGLVAAGVSALEITSFVSPKAIPQLADSKEVAKYCVEKYPDVKLYALAPNMRGVTTAIECGIKYITYVMSLSLSHNKANINRTHEQSLEALAEIMAAYPDVNICVALATTFGCPFEGIPSVQSAVDMGQKLYDMGVRTVALADTIGIADPAQVREVVAAYKAAFPEMELQIHVHDTRGMGQVCTLAAIEAGVDTVQTTLSGLGGCPFAPGASGNTATEDLVYMLDRMGYETGIDFEKMLALSKYQKTFILDGVFSGHQMNIASKSECTG